MSDAASIPDHYTPLIERGDVVRLRSPFVVDHGLMSPGGWRTALLIRNTTDDNGFATHPAMEAIFDGPDGKMAKDIRHRVFTHGAVLEVVSRYGLDELSAEAAAPISYGGVGKGPVQTVSLMLYNERSGLSALTEIAEGEVYPMTVDFLATELIVVQKHDDRLGETTPIDLHDAYGKWGIEGDGPREPGDDA